MVGLLHQFPPQNHDCNPRCPSLTPTLHFPCLLDQHCCHLHLIHVPAHLPYLALQNYNDILV